MVRACRHPVIHQAIYSKQHDCHEDPMLRRLFPRRSGFLRNTLAPGVHQRTISLLTRTASKNEPSNSTLSYIWWGTKLGVASLLAGHVFVDYFYAMHGTWGPSMIPTINASGDWVVISKYYRHGRGIQVGDLISFKHPLKSEERVIKRVIGMPGDFVLRDTPGKGDGHMVQVPAGHCWVVGDNLNASRDSRMYGPIPLGMVRGKIIAKLTGWNIFKIQRLPDALEDFTG